MNGKNAIRSRFDQVNRFSIHCYTAGLDQKGPPVVLLHGGGIDSAHLSWGGVLAPLSENFQVYAPDLPGYGKSDKPDITYSLDFYVGFLKEWMEHLGLNRIRLVGLSLGGGIAIRFAAHVSRQSGPVGSGGSLWYIQQVEIPPAFLPLCQDLPQ